MNDDKVPALNVGSFNVRCPGDKNGNSRECRLPRILQTRSDAGFDVCGIQETVPEYVKISQPAADLPLPGTAGKQIKAERLQ